MEASAGGGIGGDGGGDVGERLFWRVPIFWRVLVLRAQGKGHVCRVPEIVHTANGMAHRKPQVSGSACAANLRLLAMGHSHQRGWR